MILPEYCDLDFLMTGRHGLLRIIEDFFIQFLTIAETSILNVFNQAKQQTIPSISASDSARFQLYIYFRSFRPNFLSVIHDKGIVPHKNSTLTANFRIKPPSNAPFVLFCPLTALTRQNLPQSNLLLMIRCTT